MLVRSYTLRMQFPECDHSAEKANALAELSDDVSEVLPYLNAVLKGASYNPHVPSLLFQHGGHRIVLRPREVGVTRLEDENEARRVLDWLMQTINQMWERRAQIRPDHRATRAPGLLDIYRLLPGSNCRDCGEPSCMAFAAKLVRREARVDACRPLLSQEMAERRERLVELVPAPD